MKVPPCHRCDAACCKQVNTGYPYAVHLRDIDDPRLNEKAIIYNYDSISVKVIPYNPETGACVHLDIETNRCKVYEYRPVICRQFNCTIGFGTGLGTSNMFLAQNPQVVKIIKLEEREQVKKRREEHRKTMGE